MTTRLVLLGVIAVALAAAPAGRATRHAPPAPGTPAGLAAKLKLKTLEAHRFAHLFTLKCRVAITTTPSGPVVTNPVCTKTGARIVGALQKLDRQIQARLDKASSGSTKAKRLTRLDAQVQKLLAGLQGVLAVVPTAGVGAGRGGNA